MTFVRLFFISLLGGMVIAAVAASSACCGYYYAKAQIYSGMWDRSATLTSDTDPDKPRVLLPMPKKVKGN